MVSEKAELAACPFCGEDVEVRVADVDSRTAAVLCDNCGAYGPTRCTINSLLRNDHAAEAWNERAGYIERLHANALAATAVPAGPDASEARRQAETLIRDALVAACDECNGVSLPPAERLTAIAADAADDVLALAALPAGDGWPADLWQLAYMGEAPFTPGPASDNDAIVRNAGGYIVADCRGFEGRALLLAALLNQAFPGGRS